MGTYASSRPALRLGMKCGAMILLAVTMALLHIAADGAAEASGPPLVVATPEDGFFTNSSTLLVAGVTEPGIMVNVTVETLAVPERYIIHESTAGVDGWFEVEVGLYEGIQRVHVTATDGSGSSNTTSRIVCLDTQPPKFEINAPPRSPWHTRDDRYTIIGSFEGPDPILHAWVQDILLPVSLGVGLFKACVNLTEGENVINIRARDRAGNEWVETVVIIVDPTPPVLKVVEPSRRSVTTNRTTLHLAGNVSGASRVVVVYRNMEHYATLTGGDWDAVGSWELDLAMELVDWSWTVTVRALDHVGNEANWTVNVTVDRTAPTIVLDPEIPYKVTKPLVQIVGKVDTDVSRIDVNGVLFAVMDGEFSIFLSIEEGTTRIALEAQDAAGNRATHEEEVFYTDGPPRLGVDAPDRVWDPVVRIRGTTASNVQRVRVDGEEHPVVNGTFDVEVGLGKGRNEVTVEVVDPAGNVRTETVVVMRGLTVGEVAAILALVAGTGAAGAFVWLRRRIQRGGR